MTGVTLDGSMSLHCCIAGMQEVYYRCILCGSLCGNMWKLFYVYSVVSDRIQGHQIREKR
jgi:hypothetical protein